MWKWEAEQAKAVLVIVHGAMEHHGRYLSLIDMWTANGFHVVMGDLPAHGTSSRKRGHINSFDEYIQAAEEWVTEAKQYNLPLFLLGHSMGGLIIIRALQESSFKAEGVILSCPCLGVCVPLPAPLRAASKILNVIAPTLQFNSNLTAEMATRNREVRDSMENDSLYLRKVSVRWYSELIKAVKIAHEKVATFPDIPLLIMQACEDRLVDKVRVREWFDKLPTGDKAYKEWDKCYHDLFDEYEKDKVFSFAKHYVEAHL
ncbi:alpha/beta hydrolase [Bacillus sp. 165]|uniref:alpha/beta hydrolase n=1 Tax=Bacillus sp. 165 TaxID=1529117 RepID=UPI001ADCC1E7|nr:alpha/beta hydrolase [Bacillus sp. 165]MBO9130908.1 alpha/beta hydrolase [Bacillus sp. 165]